MPHIEIKLYPGYGEEKKQNFVHSVVAAAVQELWVFRNALSPSRSKRSRRRHGRSGCISP